VVSQTNEQALENLIQKHLTGTTLKELNTELKETTTDYNNQNQLYQHGHAKDFNPQYALDTRLFWQFLHNSQKKSLDTLKQRHPNDWQQKIQQRFDRLIKKYGIIHLLKKGLKIDDIHLDLMYPAPLASSSDKITQNFNTNIFSSSCQIHYSLDNPRQAIDTVLFLNGIPLITLELKNAWTGQTARHDGQKQYCKDRDPKQPLLNFARCLVHMTLDTDEVYMTTKLAGENTVFLPFNKGKQLGQGNPVNKYGHKTSYLWEEIFTKQSIANIIQHFVRLDGSSKDELKKRTLFFPRYHQLDVVRKLIDHASLNGVGHTYLIQHSAGSGKSNSITWAAYQLIETYPTSNTIQGSKGTDIPLFDSVIVVTDRRLLDKQLRDNIKEFSEVKNIVAPAHTSAELKAALENGKKIIITTIQKFPFIIDGISDLSEKRFAVIIDEAHSSQSGSAHDNMNRAMGKTANEEINSAEDKILEAMRSRKMRGNASYLAFTATPKNTTLEKFGQQQQDGSFKPFHLYSMKQAIEEHFILDVIANYTTYKSYYEIEKSIRENPKFDSQKAQKRLRNYVENSQQTIDTKAEIMLEHFISHVINQKKLKGQAKGMVVTQNIETTIRYYQALIRLLEQYGHPFKIAIAFSGTKEVDGTEYSEASINGFSETETKDKFDSPDYRLLVVANKYLTGFDQPKLCTMYVDKKLTGVLCVQALSRLNRAAPKLNKKMEDLFVLDFFNTVEDIKAGFDPFYTATSLSETTDINVLHELKDAMDEVGVYEWYEVEDFIKRYFNNEEAQTLSPIIDIAAQRFNDELGLEEEDKIDFKVKAKQFVKIYGQVASIMPYEMLEWEKLFWFLKHLIPKLLIKDPDADTLDALLDSVDLSSYGLQRVKLNHAIDLDEGETSVDPQNANPRGVHDNEEEEDALDEIIRNFNEKWFQGWGATPEEQRVRLLSMKEAIKKDPDFAEKYADNIDPHSRALAFEKIFKKVMLQKRSDDQEFYKLWANDPAFKASLINSMQEMLAG